jgi:membrane-bound lytic murein transglycosylase A
MIAQDTGSAITGPARADLYFGAGADAGKVSGRLRHSMRFVMLVPKSLDPAARGRSMPVPDARPSEKIAKLFPQVDPPKDSSRATEPAKNTAVTPAQPAAAAVQTSTAQTAAARVPLPEPRPNIQPSRDEHRARRYHHYRRGQ